MTILVSHGTWHVGARIIHRISEIDDLTVVGGRRRVEESMRLMADLHPAVMIIDAETGSGEGMELLRRAKSMASPPIVIMTAAAPFPQYRRETLKAGADFFFELPAQIEDMIQALAECRIRHEARNEPAQAGSELDTRERTAAGVTIEGEGSNRTTIGETV